MNNTNFDIVYDKQDFSINELPKGDYENCSFINCVFANADLSDVNFSECEFRDCDLSLCNMNNTALRTVIFNGCKLLGIMFDKCNEFLFSVEFENCNLNHSSFYKLRCKKMPFKNCNLLEVDFTECDLSSSTFDHCDLSGAVFRNSILEKVDFRTSHHYSIDPEINRIKKARFSVTGIAGLLDRHDIVIE
jgi:fluoroquinolone resistance protein